MVFLIVIMEMNDRSLFSPYFSFSYPLPILFKGFLTRRDLWLYTCTSALIPKRL